MFIPILWLQPNNISPFLIPEGASLRPQQLDFSSNILVSFFKFLCLSFLPDSLLSLLFFGSKMARGRGGVAKDKEKEKDREPDPKYAMWIIAAIGKVKGQKQRPSEDRISHILETVYGLDSEVALEQLELCVKAGKVLKVVFKDKASYKDPAKVPRHIRGTVEKPKDFIEFIKEALENVGDENGCTQQQISSYIHDHHAASLDSQTQTRLKESLKKGLASGAFIKEGRFYRLATLPKVCTVLRCKMAKV